MRMIIGWTLGLLAIYTGGCQPAKPTGPEWVFENPILQVEPEEWVLYDLRDGNSFRVEVVQVGAMAGPVLINERTLTTDVDAPIGAASQKRLSRNHMMNGYESAGWVVSRIYEDVVTVAERRWKSMCFEYLTVNQGRVKVWYTHEIPVYGMLRQAKVSPSGQLEIHTELIDWSGRQER